MDSKFNFFTFILLMITLFTNDGYQFLTMHCRCSTKCIKKLNIPKNRKGTCQLMKSSTKSYKLPRTKKEPVNCAIIDGDGVLHRFFSS